MQKQIPEIRRAAGYLGLSAPKRSKTWLSDRTDDQRMHI
jgi:hypothetical protein